MSWTSVAVAGAAFCISGAAASAQTPANGRYARVNGLSMYYEIHGRGDALVLIHGGGSTIGTTFGRILPMLARDFKIIAVELQGHGHTGDRASAESFEQDADDVAALLQYLNIPRASFFGFSNGGNAAVQIAVRHPSIVSKLVLASTFYRKDGLVPGFFDGLQKATLNDMPRQLKDAFMQATPDSSKLLAMFNNDRNRMLRFVDWKEETVSSITAQTLIINGDRDVIQAGHALAMAKLIPDSRLMILPATHGSYIGVAESLEPASALISLTAEVIREFLLKQ